MKYIAIFFGILFVLFAYFQFNDPDSEIWIITYSVAALACFMALRELWPWWVFAILAVGYLVGAIVQWPAQFEGVLFGEMGMRSMNIELARESLGLGMCAIANGLLAWMLRR
ncbi:transmembrane 220 family protein [Telluribacter sp. SYSU D00476]|uniref:transmembrane 220 family protein n=1 Tax=Telluribacter sp. SYSU D00476 TaxID=2811430 RepID=UPI001FF46004|nr:transmembrane 220 family protein [Telluribacter sp. SYSU D00476]